MIGDLSQRQMVIKKHEDETPKERHKRQIRNRMVYNDWCLYGSVQMLELKCISMCFEGQTYEQRDTHDTHSRDRRDSSRQ
jgi:hypothetical protein